MPTCNRFFLITACILLAAGCGTASPAITPAGTPTPSKDSAPLTATSTPAVPTVQTPPRLLSGPYLGETLPGAEPRVFGRGLLKGEYHSSPTFTPDGREVYWGGEFSRAEISRMKLVDGNWTGQEALQIPGMATLRDPFLSPDGRTLFFLSKDPLPGSAASGKENIWMAAREGENWGTPQPLPAVINEMELHWTISVANNGNLYFSSGKGGIGDIYVSAYVDHEYTRPVLLDSTISTADQIEVTPNVAPDESYILFSRMRDTSSTPRLYISYSTAGGWTEPRLVENVRSCISPIVTPERSYVFCLSGPDSLIWRDTSFINMLRP